MDEQLDEIYAFAVQLGKSAGDRLLSFTQARIAGSCASCVAVAEKDSSVDIVTEADTGTSRHCMTCLTCLTCIICIAIEAFIRDAIAERYPHHRYCTHRYTLRC